MEPSSSGGGSSQYSQLKPAWHASQLAELRAGREPRPVHVQLILSDLCSQDCHFCSYRMSTGLSTELFGTAATHNPNRKIPTAKALEILEDCAALGVKAVQFTGGGEPTVHPDHLAIFARAQELGLETALVTNGVRLDATHPGVQAMTWVRVSVDAGSADVYARIRRCPPWHWTSAWANITTLARSDFFKGVLGVGFVVTLENFHGIAAAAQRARDSGAHNMRVGAVFSKFGMAYYGDQLQAIHDAIAEARAAVDGGGFKIIDLFGRRLGDLEAGAPEDSECYYQYLTMYIGGDLNVYRCCNTAYTTAGKVGSLATTRLRDLVAAYAPFDARGCQYCQFLGQNRVIKALVEQPEHVNFV